MAKIYIGENADSVKTGDALSGYSQVVITSNGKQVQSAGDTSGRTLTVEIPYASNNGSLAANMLARIQGYSYKPVTATNAETPPTAEIGDGMTAGGAYSGIYSESKKYGHRTTNTVAASNDEEINHEFPSGTNGKYATYTGLSAGTTAVNGSGLINRSVSGTKVKTNTISGGSNGNLKSTTVSYDNTMFQDTLDQVQQNAADIATIKVGVFNTVGCNTLRVGDYYILTSGGTLSLKYAY